MKAAAALGEIGDESAAEPLIEAFEHPIGNLRREVVQALDALATPKAVPLFRKAAQDSDIDVRKAAERALARARQVFTVLIQPRGPQSPRSSWLIAARGI